MEESRDNLLISLCYLGLSESEVSLCGAMIMESADEMPEVERAVSTRSYFRIFTVSLIRSS